MFGGSHLSESGLGYLRTFFKIFDLFKEMYVVENLLVCLSILASQIVFDFRYFEYQGVYGNLKK